ncbi:hypothetical protein QFZ78_000625 [Paenibacillus sp. V4I5]|nr:hypothetical protein [Paenibacillus sp. V4I5]
MHDSPNLLLITDIPDYTPQISRLMSMLSSLVIKEEPKLREITSTIISTS